jgi:HlyD family secretion protein
MQKMLNSLNSFRLKLGKWFWAILVVILIIIWRVIAGANTPVKVQTTSVTRGDIVQTVSTSGTVKADQYSQLTFPTGGLIKSVYVKSGDTVKKGAWIASLDTVPLNAVYQDALNTYRATQAAVDLEHDNDKNYGSAETFAQKSTRTAAEVANDDAYNNVLAAQDNLRNANLLAPFNGIIDTAMPSSPGIQVLPGAANYTIVNPSSVYFDAEVEETDLSNIKVGQSVNITLDAYPNQTFQGTVTTIGIVAFTSSTGGNAYHVRVSLPDNSGQKFRVGMGGDVDIIYNTVSQVLKVPASAVTTDSTNYVWVIESGRAKMVQVEVGGSNADEVEIKSGLTEGQVVISQPPTDIKEGTRVST